MFVLKLTIFVNRGRSAVGLEAVSCAVSSEVAGMFRPQPVQSGTSDLELGRKEPCRRMWVTLAGAFKIRLEVLLRGIG